MYKSQEKWMAIPIACCCIRHWSTCGNLITAYQNRLINWENAASSTRPFDRTLVWNRWRIPLVGVWTPWHNNATRDFPYFCLYHASHVYIGWKRKQTLYPESMQIFLDLKKFLFLNPPQKVTEAGKTTKSAHPGTTTSQSRSDLLKLTTRFGYLARFSPDDKFSRHRVTIKKRYGVLMTQAPPTPM